MKSIRKVGCGPRVWKASPQQRLSDPPLTELGSAENCRPRRPRLVSRLASAAALGRRRGNGHPRRFCRHGRQHPADQAAPRLRGDRLHDPRQGRVPQPRRLGQGSRRALHHQGRRGARPAEAGRRHRRRHRRQYRHRPRAGRQRTRLPHRHRHARDAEPGKEGHAAAVRRRSQARPGRALRQPEQLRALFRPPRRGDRRAGAERRDLGQPVRQPRQPPRPSTRRPAPKSGPRPTARWTASPARSAPAAHCPASASP